MKKILLVRMGGLLLVSLMLSCTAKNMEEQKAQAEASRNLGEAYLQQGKMRAALKELKKAEQLYPDDSILQDDLGLVYFFLENQDRAILFSSSISWSAPAAVPIHQPFASAWPPLPPTSIHAMPPMPLLNA